MERYNRKYFKCKVCGGKHYARELCRSHYNKFLDGRPMEYPKCKICGKKVLANFEKQLCLKCSRIKPPRYKKDGGKWGYKNYRAIQEVKKLFCELCGNIDNLVIHHKDKNKRNSAIENLVTICSKCHAKQHLVGKSKYIEKYSKTLCELSKEFNLSRSVIRYRLKKNIPLTRKLHSQY